MKFLVRRLKPLTRRAVSLRPDQPEARGNCPALSSLKVRYSGESTTLFTSSGFAQSVAFSSTPRNPKYARGSGIAIPGRG